MVNVINNRNKIAPLKSVFFITFQLLWQYIFT